MFKKHFSCALWLGILNLPLAWFCSIAYAPQGETPWFVMVTFIFAVTGQLFVYFALISIILIFPVFNWRKRIGIGSIIYTLVILVIAHMLLNIDASVFDMYDRHLIEYALSIQDTSNILNNMPWMHWVLQLIITIVFSSLALTFAIVLSNHSFRVWPYVLLAVLMYILSTAIFAFSNSRNVEPLVKLETYNLPGFINIGSLVSESKWLSPKAGNVENGETTPDSATTNDSNLVTSAFGTSASLEGVSSSNAQTDELTSDAPQAVNTNVANNANAASTTTSANNANAENAQSDNNGQNSPQNTSDAGEINPNTINNSGTTEPNAALDSTNIQPNASAANQGSLGTEATTPTQGSVGAITPSGHLRTTDPVRDPRNFNPFSKNNTATE